MTKKIFLILIFLFVFLHFSFSPKAFADSISIDFESPSYTTGTIHNQDGWTSIFGAGIGGILDHEVSTQSLFAGFGNQSLRISNFWTTSDLLKQTFSKPLADEAGDAGALSGGFSGGSRKDHFEAEWDFASVSPLAQSNLFVAADLDRGDGSIMGKIIMKDTPSGLQVEYQGYNDLAPLGSVTTPSDGCGPGGDSFAGQIVATGLSRSTVHNLKITVDFNDGSHNDVVKIYIDGILQTSDTTWEDYYRWCSLTIDQSRTVDSVLFVTEGLSGGTFGQGLYIDNLKLLSGLTQVPPPSAKDECKNGGWEIFNTPTFKNQGQCVSYVNHN